MKVEHENAIYGILQNNLSNREAAKEICNYVDSIFTQALIDNTEMGKILEAVDLEIRCKRDKK